MDFQPGDILQSKKTNHPIIFLEKLNAEEFLGCIITHANSSRYPENIELDKKHFHEFDSLGKQFSVRWDQTYFVEVVLKKRKDWGPYRRNGRLTDEGLKLVYAYIDKEKPQTWVCFMNRKREIT